MSCHPRNEPQPPSIFLKLAASSSTPGACWGDNASGQLGRGTFAYSTVPVAVAPF